VNVGSDILGGYVWLNDQPILCASQVICAWGANEAVCAIGKFEMSTTVRLIIFSEALLPVADWMRISPANSTTECQVRFGLAFQVSIEKVVSDQYPMIAV
jgi:hypothetical protein